MTSIIVAGAIFALLAWSVYSQWSNRREAASIAADFAAAKDEFRRSVARAAEEIVVTGTEFFKLEVAGENHDNPDGVNRQSIIAKLKAGDSVRLIREPNNPHDSNAIRVDSRLGTIGYISRNHARRIAGQIDGGANIEATISDIAGGTPGKPSRGVWLTAEIAT